jgi:hypothetical protein
MFEFLRSEIFNTVASFLVGVAIMSLLKPKPKDDDLRDLKAPAFDEVKTTTYQISSGSCWKFRAETVTCPPTGVIEPFERRAS